MNFSENTRLEIRAAAGHLVGEALGLSEFVEDEGWKIIDQVFEELLLKRFEQLLQVIAIGKSVNHGETIDDVTAARLKHHLDDLAVAMQRGMEVTGSLK